MKKMWLILPILAGILVMGCPTESDDSDPDPVIPGKTLVYTADIEIDAGEYGDAAIGQGNIMGEYYQMLLDAPEGSVLRFNFTCTVHADANPQRGWTIGYVGSIHGEDDTYKQNLLFNVPDTAEIKTDSQFTIDLLVSDCLLHKHPEYSIVWVNPWGFLNARITKCALWEYK